MRITGGSKVTLHFSLRLVDGPVAESSFDDQPVTFVMGDGTLDKGLELALYGLKTGDRQKLTLMPGQAFGQRDEAAIETLARDRFPADMQLETGQILAFSSADGEDIPGAIIEVGAEQVKVDFNHPLAGREIEFEVEILNVENPPSQ